MNIYSVLSVVSLILRYISIILLIPCICAICLKEYYAIIPFVGASIISFGFGYLFRDKNKEEESNIAKSVFQFTPNFMKQKRNNPMVINSIIGY